MEVRSLVCLNENRFQLIFQTQIKLIDSELIDNPIGLLEFPE
jgi:hypothetical protein